MQGRVIPKDVIEKIIKLLLTDDIPIKCIAERFGVSNSVVDRINRDNGCRIYVTRTMWTVKK